MRHLIEISLWPGPHRSRCRTCISLQAGKFETSWDRFAGIWQTPNWPLASLLLSRTQTLSEAKKRSCCSAYNRNTIYYSFWKVEFAKLLKSSVFKVGLNGPFGIYSLHRWVKIQQMLVLLFFVGVRLTPCSAPLVGCIGDKTVRFPFGIAEINSASGSGIIIITKSTLQKLSLTRQAFAGRGN